MNWLIGIMEERGYTTGIELLYLCLTARAVLFTTCQAHMAGTTTNILVWA